MASLNRTLESRVAELEQKLITQKRILAETVSIQKQTCHELKMLSRSVEALLKILVKEKEGQRERHQESELPLDSFPDVSTSNNNYPRPYSMMTALIVGGDYRGAWSDLTRTLFEAQIQPSFVEANPNVLKEITNTDSYDILFMSTRMSQTQSQPIQTMLRKLFSSALLVGVAKDPVSMQDATEPIYVYGFDEIITAKTTPADIQRLLSRYQQQQHARQLFNLVTPGIDQFFISPEPTSAGLEQLSFISQLKDFSTYQSEESE